MDIDDDRMEEEENEESFAELLEQSFVKTTKLEPGQKVEATVLKISKDWVFLDVGQKGEGVLDRREIVDEQGALTVAEGDVLSTYFLSRQGGELRFTTRIGGGAPGHAQLEEAWRSGIPVEGTVEKEIKGGFEVKLAGAARAFCPFSQMSLRRTDDPSPFIGKALPFKISQYAERGRNIVVSHRAILEEERRKQKEALRETLKEGTVVSGTVTQLKPFGAFIDIGGVEGLLPISEVGWSRVENIEEVLSVGQQLEVAVKGIDWEADRFSFSLKETLADPWQRVGEKFPEGSVHSGTVVRLAPFGAFVALGEGIDGLVHISRLSGGKRINHPREVVKEGETIAVRVEKIDSDAKRISLVPAAEAAGEAEEAPEVDFSKYVDKSSSSSMGTLGDLLKAKSKKKK